MKIEPRRRKVRILATLGPASSTYEQIRALYLAGADAFRLNMSHGGHEGHTEVVNHIRALERETSRPMTILADLQGPKIRIGRFDEPVELKNGQRFTLDRHNTPGNTTRAFLPHPEIFGVTEPGQRLLIDDGKVALRVLAVTSDVIETEVTVGGRLSSNKGLNVPDAVVPLAALTEKDRRDLDFALDAGVDWVALSFVQRPEDVAEARRLIGGRAQLLAKIEKPQALDRLNEILEIADAVMVARGDLGVEMPPEAVPMAQKRIVQAARKAGRPVVVATQMLESMITSPTPTRAEVSDVANAVYDGADAVMLSAESAAGAWPVEAVRMMDAIAGAVETDPEHARRVHFTETLLEPTTADALSSAAGQIAGTISARAVCCFTTSGSTARRASRERINVPLLVLTPKLATARQLGLLWGVHAVHTRDVGDFEEMVNKAKRMALRAGVAGSGDRIIIMAGVPFGTPGSTNVLHIARLTGDELKGRK
ncbi:pyruvate kinase [Sphingosinicella microcystinivorans]|uniref:Pyruvate kinase n=1 Tax=Sphingosinicella microcystinivorans TaxID=335406 RepID=A0AAD1G067_SPHMI|nr:pyruvate kinase [Sphingosinicella microcystinivorans]RKS90534.1 pyruvate kinase [Sphingosinicella microcystinivorans]BBE33448.1 pyruvate kinase [Sphingosinicella microcystinivorans]